MKILFNSDQKAIRAGEFVEANNNIGEFIIDTESDIIKNNQDWTVALLHELCAANGIRANKKANRSDLIECFFNGLHRLELPRQDQPTQSAIIRDIVAECGKNRNGEENDAFEVSVFTQVIQKLNAMAIGFKIRSLGALVKQEIAAQGLIVSMSTRREAADKIIEDFDCDFATWEAVQPLVDKIVEEVPDTTVSQAMTCLRRWCKQKEIELPRKAAGRKSISGYRNSVLEYMIANSPVEEEALHVFIRDKFPQRKDPKKDAARFMRNVKLIDMAVKWGQANPVAE